ncbi:hypothetical protein ACFVXG_41895 [Kitasatospora sp. NPDC058162]|uniref:hypothetical protein n=1 Tax=Kitasatospora sp. NPDC058162 TaxID=3346362 RepID=UPI0036DF0A16
MPQDTLASLTTLRLGGPADTVLTISDPAQWPDATREVGHSEKNDPVVLGHGAT